MQIQAVIKSNLETVFVNTLTYLSHYTIHAGFVYVISGLFGLVLVVSLWWIRNPVINSVSEICIQDKRTAFANGRIMKIKVFVAPYITSTVSTTSH